MRRLLFDEFSERYRCGVARARLRSADGNAAANKLAGDDPQSLQLARIEGAARDLQPFEALVDIRIERAHSEPRLTARAT
jgi:hypothetical protein